MNIILRGKTYFLRRRVPLQFAEIEPRRWVQISLKTDSASEAEARAKAAWDQLVLGWQAAMAGSADEAETRYQAARRVAQAYGFRFLPAEKVAELPMEELLSRIEAARKPGGGLNPALVPGLLGTAKKPSMKLSDVLDTYWTIAADRTMGKSPDQVRRWKNPRLKAFKNLIEVVGDLALDEITADDFLDFRGWWWDKISEEDLTPNSANKDFTHIGSTLRLVAKAKRIPVPPGLDGLNFSEGGKRTRLPFSEEWIKKKLLAPGALDGLNTEARCIVLGMVNTGYRPSEGAGLLAHHIRLDGDFPHISIEPEGRTLKNASSRRIIPLAGVSLEAFRQSPGGFPRYAGGSAGLSATVNKFLRENGLLETKGHSLYGLRHSFEDRLLDRDVDERIRRDLMGHALSRERYGKGASPEKLMAVVRSIAL